MGCKGAQCSVVDELKQIRILSLKFGWLHLCLWNTKKFCKALVPSGFKSLKMDLKWKKYEAGTKEGSKAIVSKKLKQNMTHPLCVFSALPCYKHSKNICSPSVCMSDDTKIA